MLNISEESSKIFFLKKHKKWDNDVEDDMNCLFIPVVYDVMHFYIMLLLLIIFVYIVVSTVSFII